MEKREKEKEAGVIEELKAIAGQQVPASSIHLDETSNPLLFVRSGVKWENSGPLGLQVYYHHAGLALPIMAHEVGHLQTMAEAGGWVVYHSSEGHRYIAEAYASRWAMAYLSKRGIKGYRLNECLAFLQDCLDSYRPAAHKRIELRERVEVEV